MTIVNTPSFQECGNDMLLSINGGSNTSDTWYKVAAICVGIGGAAIALAAAPVAVPVAAAAAGVAAFSGSFALKSTVVAVTLDVTGR